MAEKFGLEAYEGGPVETYTYSAGSYERLKSDEEELYELVRLSEVPIDKELFKVILEFLKLNVAPAAILQVLKSLRSQNTPEDLESRSPATLQKASAIQQHPSTPTSDTHLPSAPFISGTSLVDKDLINHGEAATSERSDQDANKVGSSQSGTKYSGKHKSRDHKQRSSKTKKKEGNERDPTGGSAKLKIKEKVETS